MSRISIRGIQEAREKGCSDTVLLAALVVELCRGSCIPNRIQTTDFFEHFSFAQRADTIREFLGSDTTPESVVKMLNDWWTLVYGDDVPEGPEFLESRAA
jgi:hypothetical protein